MTERELSQARSLQAELDALRRVAAIEPSREVLDAIGGSFVVQCNRHPSVGSFLSQPPAFEQLGATPICRQRFSDSTLQPKVIGIY